MYFSKKVTYLLRMQMKCFTFVVNQKQSIMTIKEKILEVKQAIEKQSLTPINKASYLLHLIDDCQQAVEDSNINMKPEAEKFFADAWDVVEADKALGLLNQHQAMQVILVAQILFDK